KSAMMDVVRKQSDKLDLETADLEKKAMDTMKKNGLIIHEAPADSLPKWKEEAAKGMDELIGKKFSREIYDRLQQILREYRGKNAG
ncbi:MAG: hypothetical protein PHX05_07120, partial [Acidobacteriota bacterium]|nr:hypothetical protein [Acidobacteriota bacterium]